MVVYCNKCGQGINIPEGKRLEVRCPKCSYTFIFDDRPESYSKTFDNSNGKKSNQAGKKAAPKTYKANPNAKSGNAVGWIITIAVSLVFLVLFSKLFELIPSNNSNNMVVNQTTTQDDLYNQMTIDNQDIQAVDNQMSENSSVTETKRPSLTYDAKKDNEVETNLNPVQQVVKPVQKDEAEKTTAENKADKTENKSDAKTDSKTDNNTDKKPSINTKNQTEVDLMEITPYNDGYAWANFGTQDYKAYFGCIDKSGNIYSAYDTSKFSCMTNFYNGVAGVLEGRKYHIIDIYGNILHTENLDGRTNAFYSCGKDGNHTYFVFSEYKATFDTAKTVFYCYDERGQLVFTTEYDFNASFIQYIGEGVFGAGDPPGGIPGADITSDIYFIDINNKKGHFVKWVSWERNGIVKGNMGGYVKDGPVNFANYIEFKNDKMYLDLSVNDNKYPDGYSLDLKTGELTKLETIYHNNIKYSNSDNKDGDWFYIESDTGLFKCKRSSTGATIVFDGYEEQLAKGIHDKNSNTMPAYDYENGKVLVYPYQGKDGKYFVTFDDKGRKLTEPVKYDKLYSKSIKCDRIIYSLLNDIIVADGNGKEVYKLSNLGVSELTYEDYSDDVLIADMHKVFDLNGKLLFDNAKIDKNLLK